MERWMLEPAYAELATELGSLAQVFALKGERLTRDRISEVIRIERNGVCYYVKRYRSPGKGGFRHFLGAPKVQKEWQSLQYFQKWGIATVPIVAYGIQRYCGAFVRGALITREVVDTTDLATLAQQQDPRLKDRHWVEYLSRQLAEATRQLHAHRFTHNDLKWRNLLVNSQGQVFWIDCPSGRFWVWPFLHSKIIKDLACLDKVAKRQLSRTQRLRFFLHYRQHLALTPEDKRMVRQIGAYFQGRD